MRTAGSDATAGGLPDTLERADPSLLHLWKTAGEGDGVRPNGGAASLGAGPKA